MNQIPIRCFADVQYRGDANATMRFVGFVTSLHIDEANKIVRVANDDNGYEDEFSQAIRASVSLYTPQGLAWSQVLFPSEPVWNDPKTPFYAPPSESLSQSG